MITVVSALGCCCCSSGTHYIIIYFFFCREFRIPGCKSACPISWCRFTLRFVSDSKLVVSSFDRRFFLLYFALLIRRRPNASPSSTTSRSALWNPAWIRTNSVGMCVLYGWINIDSWSFFFPYFLKNLSITISLTKIWCSSINDCTVSRNFHL